MGATKQGLEDSRLAKEKLTNFINSIDVPMSIKCISQGAGVSIAFAYDKMNDMQHSGSIKVDGTGKKGARLFIGA